jgi:hypothetical protein
MVGLGETQAVESSGDGTHQAGAAAAGVVFGAGAKVAEAMKGVVVGAFAVVKKAAPQAACSIQANTLALPNFRLGRLAGEDPKLPPFGTFEGHHPETRMEEAQDKGAEEVHPEVPVVPEHRGKGEWKPAVNIVTEAI